MNAFCGKNNQRVKSHYRLLELNNNYNFNLIKKPKT